LSAVPAADSVTSGVTRDRVFAVRCVFAVLRVFAVRCVLAVLRVLAMLSDLLSDLGRRQALRHPSDPSSRAATAHHPEEMSRQRPVSTSTARHRNARCGLRAGAVLL